MQTIAYIAPELTALSETFVYEEVEAVEQAGFRVLPFCVRRPGRPALEAQALAERTVVLYDRHPAWLVMSGFVAAASFGTGSIRPLMLVLGDIARAGVFRAGSWKLLYQWLTAARMGRSLRAAGCVHIHAHFVSVPTQIAMYASAFTGIPFTATAHANDIFQNGLLLTEKAARSRKLLTISEYNLDYLAGIGVPRQRMAIVRCTPDFGSVALAEAVCDDAPYRVGTLCRLVEKKGVDDLIRAAALLAARGVDLRLEIAGDGPERVALEGLVQTSGLQDRVTFLGAMDHREVGPWMRGLHVFALACKVDRHGDIDGIPVVLMEAMSLGVPVLSTVISGIPELVIDGQTGTLAVPADAGSVASKLGELLADGDRRRALATAGRSHVASEFGRPVNIRRLIDGFGLTPARRS